MYEWVLWILVAASALHVVEEHGLGWQGWANKTIGKKLGIKLGWDDFWPTNGALIIVGISTAMVGWSFAAFALSFAALNLINAIFFHILPSIIAKRPNPGCFTAILLYLPIGTLCYVAANTDKVLTLGTVLLSIVIGAFFMASALATPLLRPRFGYPDAKN